MEIIKSYDYVTDEYDLVQGGLVRQVLREAESYTRTPKETALQRFTRRFLDFMDEGVDSMQYGGPLVPPAIESPEAEYHDISQSL